MQFDLASRQHNHSTTRRKQLSVLQQTPGPVRCRAVVDGLLHDYFRAAASLKLISGRIWGGKSRTRTADSRGPDSVWVMATKKQGSMVFGAHQGPGGYRSGLPTRKFTMLSNRKETSLVSNLKVAALPGPPRYMAPVVRPVPIMPSPLSCKSTSIAGRSPDGAGSTMCAVRTALPSKRMASRQGSGGLWPVMGTTTRKS